MTAEADRAGRERGFIQRVRKLKGSSFVQMLEFGFWANPAASLAELCQSGQVCRVEMSAQGLEALAPEVMMLF